MKTVDDYLSKDNPNYKFDDYNYDKLKNFMIKFAEYHVEACKKDIIENAKIELSENWIRKEETIKPGSLIAPIIIKINKDSILNAYPLINIT